MDRERLMKMAGAVRTGGKGSMRRFVFTVRMFTHRVLIFAAVMSQIDLAWTLLLLFCNISNIIFLKCYIVLLRTFRKCIE
jgi:hypothetical protein